MPVNENHMPQRQFSAAVNLEYKRSYTSDGEPQVIMHNLAGQDIYPESRIAREEAWKKYQQKLAEKLAGTVAVHEASTEGADTFPVPGFRSWQEVYASTTYVASGTEIPKQAGSLVLVDQIEKTA